MIRLQRSVPVRTFDAEATVAVGRDRPEFLAVARLAADLGQSLDGATVARELLGGLPEAIGWRVVERAVAMGLLERRGDRGPAVLSTAGAAALEDNAVLVPEEGAWRFFFVDDPLVDEPLVHVERLRTESARDERKALFARRDAGAPRSGPGERTPDVVGVRREDAPVLRSVVSGQPFRPLAVAERGARGPEGVLDLVLELSEASGPATVRARGRVPTTRDEQSSRVDRVLGTPTAVSNVTYDDLWTALAEAASVVPEEDLRAWRERAGARVIPVAFDDGVNEAERRTQRRRLLVPPLELQGLGQFDESALDDAQILPRSAEDARAWVEWLAWESVTDYSTADRLVEIARAAGARFPAYNPPVPSPADMLRRALANPADSRARFVLAPSDLGLWR